MKLPRLWRPPLFVALGVLVGLLLMLGVYVLGIRTPVTGLTAVADQVPAPLDPGFLELMAANTGTRFEGGHSLEILLDGGTFERLWTDLRSARRSITLQLYYCQPGALADTLAAILGRRAHAGVPVLFLYDGFGCDPLGDAYFRRLAQAGVEVHSFRPVRWWSLHKAQERSHTRIIVIDGAIGYTGGFGIDDRWSAAGVTGEPGWRETNIRFTGPSVIALQAAFADGWAETTGRLLAGPRFYPREALRGPEPAAAEESCSRETAVAGQPASAGSVVAGLLHSTPDLGSTTAERLLVLTMAAARERLWISNAYFVPDPDLRAMLIAAARRGVDVRVLTPDDDTDVPLVRYAARARYPELLAGGVRIYEYRPAMMHAKTFVVDGLWSAIGSMNFDNRSIAVNDETALLVLDRSFGARMDSIFLADTRRATEITPELLEEASFGARLKERLAVLLAPLL